MSIKIWHACFENGNFGDHVGRYVMEKLTGQPTEFCHDSSQYDEVYVYSGSVLSESKSNWICFGLGFGHEMQTIHEVPKKVMSVRGKLSRNMLLHQGVECPDIYFDICEYLPKLFRPHTEKLYKVGYLPHYVDYEEYLTILCWKYEESPL